MRLGFDVTPLLGPQSGIGTYTSNLLDHLVQASTSLQTNRPIWRSSRLPTAG